MHLSIADSEPHLNEPLVLANSAKLPPEVSGNLLQLPRQKAGWQWMSFHVRRLLPGEVLEIETVHEEAVCVLLGGTCRADWGEGVKSIGQRKNVFDGLPYTLYLPAHSGASFVAETMCEIAECRVPSDARLAPKLITPKDVLSMLRGGGNNSRQIVDVMPPEFAADKLMVIEVYTPGGNWSSYPPHKHDTENLPEENDLDEIYYYRISQPAGFALQHLYEGRQEECTLKAQDGDVVLVHSGYHTVVAAPGYDVYYLNILAGSSRMMAVTDDRHHAWVRSTWDSLDPRLPLVRE
jgi:5-deoxy-glucuronate isomerase